MYGEYMFTGMWRSSECIHFAIHRNLETKASLIWISVLVHINSWVSVQLVPAFRC
jgi:hypothetical protein